MICRPIIEYGHIVTINQRSSTRKNLEVGERNSLRALTKMRHPNNALHNPPNDMLYSITEIEPFLDRSRRLATRFINNSINSTILAPILQERTLNKRKFPEKTLWEYLQEMKT